jgi:endonuclease-3
MAKRPIYQLYHTSRPFLMDPATRAVLLRRFRRMYPDPRSELDFCDAYQLAVAVVLSAQCTDKKVNEVTPALFRRYPSFARLAAAKVSDIEKIIRPVNYYRTKARNLVSLARTVVEEPGGELPATHSGLIALPGVGNKTANVILSELGQARTFPVDTHVFRVSKRLGLARGETVEEVERELRALFDPRHWRNLHHWLIFHGRRVCKAGRPLCEACALCDICPSCDVRIPAQGGTP